MIVASGTTEAQGLQPVVREAAMHDVSTQRAVGGEVGHSSQRTDHVHCRYCGSRKVYRLYREGFWQERIFPLLGFYPWKCKICSANMLLHKRTRSKPAEHAD